MINKVAEMTRLAEVRGCMAAFHDAGLIKCASEDAFDNFCEVVADQIGYDYDLQKIAGVVDRYLSAMRGTKIKDAREVLTQLKNRQGDSWDALRNARAGSRNLFGGAKNQREMAAAKQQIQAEAAQARELGRQGKIERALAWGGTGAAGLAGVGGVAYGAGAFDR